MPRDDVLIGAREPLRAGSVAGEAGSSNVLISSAYCSPRSITIVRFQLETIGDAISFGRPYIANPDLVDRIRLGAPLNEGDVATFCAGGAEGYIDYPALRQAKAA